MKEQSQCSQETNCLRGIETARSLRIGDSECNVCRIVRPEVKECLAHGTDRRHRLQ